MLRIVLNFHEHSYCDKVIYHARPSVISETHAIRLLLLVELVGLMTEEAERVVVRRGGEM